MTRADSLGQIYTLTGFQAYASINNNRLAAGDAIVSDVPGFDSPDPVVLGAITLTAVAFSIVFTPTPLGAGERAFTSLLFETALSRSRLRG